MNSDDITTPVSRCPKCGAELPAGTPAERCPKCLLKAGLAGPLLADSPATHATTSPSGISRGLPQPGTQIGHYSIVRLLGSGGMGAVFEAQDLDNGRRVALKVLSQSLDMPEARQRFLREGRLAASLNHPNSVYVFGTEEIAGIPVIAMELVAGGTLHDRVKSLGPLPPGEAVDAVLQIIAGLRAAQRVGILHRDVKPSNCFTAPDGTVKIGDFGLSISTSIRLEPALTSSGAFLGTPAFCSPEQLRGEELSARSDIYSVGATLYYLLTGRTPFEGRNVVQLLATVLEQTPKSPAQVRAGIPTGLGRIVLRCLEKDPSQRFRGYDELARALAPYGSAAPNPATLGLRLVAAVCDNIILAALGNLFFFITFGSPFAILQIIGRSSSKGFIALGLWGVFAVLYYGLPEGLVGATPGKALVRLRVIRLNRTTPGIGRALARAVMCMVIPASPYWICYLIWGSQFAYSTAQSVGLLFYVLLAALFSTARQRNGFAAVHDLVTGTRVVSRANLVSRAASVEETVPPALVEGEPVLGPYHVLQILEKTPSSTWLLGFDLRLLRPVWIRQVPPGAPPVPGEIRNVGRVGRLRWLNGVRSETESWDAFEAPSGRPFLKVVEQPQSWKQARFWIDDAARELRAAERDGSLPLALGLDRLWVTAEGQLKLLDFPAPGTVFKSEQAAPGPGSASPGAAESDPMLFLRRIASAAFSGAPSSQMGAPSVPLPLHARKFLLSLSTAKDLGAVHTALKPLLTRVPEITRLRRAVLVAGCASFPFLAVVAALLGTAMLRNWNASQPGLIDLSNLLHQRGAMRFWGGRLQQVDDRQLGIFIASRYASVVTNQAIWNGPIAEAMIQGSARQFAEQSLTNYAGSTPEEVRGAEDAVKVLTPPIDVLDFQKSPWMPLVIFATTLSFYVAVPAILGALLFRGGLVLLSAGVTFVNRAGHPASRLRLFWRALVAWSCLGIGLIAFLGSSWMVGTMWAGVIGLAAVALLAGVSLSLPERGIQDRLAGTWPVPR